MRSLIIKFRDGSERSWKQDTSMSNYAEAIRYETGFVVVTDRYDNETAIPSADIASIETEAANRRSGW